MAALLAVGCSSIPPARFHSLLPTELQPAAAPPAAPVFVELGPINVPPSVDQPQWVIRTADDSLRVLEQERWVAPLRDELRAALMEGLARRWGATDSRTAAMPPKGTSWRLRVDVLRFETVAGSGAWLHASWSLASNQAGGPALNCQTQLREAAGTEPLALAAAHRRTVARLADQIGAQLKALSTGQAAACGDAG